MEFQKNTGTGKTAGFIFSYVIFSSLFYFIANYFSADISIIEAITITATITFIGLLLRRWLE